MGGEYVDITLGELVFDGGGFVQTGPFGSQLHAADYVDLGLPCVMPVNIGPRRVELDGIARITEADAARLSKHMVQEGDIVYSRRGDVTRKAIIGANDEQMICGTGCLLVRPGSRVNAEYLNYHLSSPESREWIVRHAIGATMPNLNTTILSSLPLRVPDRKIQDAIVHMLVALDDKIELDRQTNQTLEAMAQALFKSWFVDFDPVIDNALAAGNEIPEPLKARAAARQALGDARKPLPEEIRREFPDGFEFVDEMGWVPRGWQCRVMTDFVDTISETYNFEQIDNIIFLNTGDISNGHILKNEYSPVADLPGQAKKRIKRGDILYSEIRPKNRRFAFVNIDATDYVVSTKLMVLRAKGAVDPLFPYFVLKQSACIERLQQIAESRSGTFPQITYSQLSEIKLSTSADMKLVKLFSEFVLKASHDKSVQLECESTQLVFLRDTLLPKLLSGQLTIPDAEKLVSNAL